MPRSIPSTLRRPGLRALVTSFAVAVAIFLSALGAPPELAAQAPEPTLSGRVVDRSGAPVAGARVELTERPNRWRALEGRVAGDDHALDLIDSATTDEDGLYQLTATDLGLYSLRVSADGMLPIRFLVDPLSLDTRLPAGTLAPASKKIEVSVRDHRGKPLAAADLDVVVRGAAFEGWQNDGPFLLVTDDKGRTEVSVELPGTAFVVARQRIGPSWLSSEQKTISSFDGRRVPDKIRLDLPQPDPVYARVQRAGEPVAGAILSDLLGPLAVSDENGLLRFQRPTGDDRPLVVLHGRDVAIVASKDLQKQRPETKNAETEVDPTASATGSEPTNFPVIELADTGEFTGRVIDDQGQPVADAVVWSGNPMVVDGDLARADRTGHFALPRLGPLGHTVLVWAAAPGYTPAAETFDLRDTAIHDLVLQPAVRAQVRVVDEGGSPIPDVGLLVRQNPSRSAFARHFVAVPAANTSTDSDGWALLSQLRPGEAYLAELNKPGYERVAEELTAPTSDAADEPIVWTLQTGIDVVGVVVDAEDRPVADAAAMLDSSSRGPKPQLSEPPASSGPDGTFSIEDVGPGSYSLRIGSPTAGHLTQLIEIPRGPRVFDLGRVRLDEGIDLQGIVVDEDGAPVAGVRVLPGAVGAPSEVAGEIFSDADGRFAVRGVPEGQMVIIHAWMDGYRQVSQAHYEPPLPEELRIVLARAPMVRGIVVDRFGAPIVASIIAIVRDGDGGASSTSTTTLSDGTFEFRSLSPGRLTLEATHHESGTARRVFELAPGQDVDGLELVLEPAGDVSGQVVDAAGEPVRQASIVLSEASTENAGERPATRTDIDGFFRIAQVRAATYWVAAHAEGFEMFRERREVSAAGLSDLRIVLQETQLVHGRLVDDDGLPLADVEVRNPAAREVQRTDEDGRFTFRLTGHNQLSFERASLRLEVFDLPKELPDETFVVRFPSGSTELVGRILGVDDGELSTLSLHGACTLDRTSRLRIDLPPKLDHTFGATGLPACTWGLFGHIGSKERRERFEVVDGQPQVEVTLDFGKGLDLRGALVVDGAPLSGASLIFRRQNRPPQAAQTNAAGLFQVSLEEPDTYWVVVRHGSSNLEHGEFVEVSPGADLHIALWTSLVRGHLLPGGHLHLEQDGRTILVRRAQPDGAFEIRSTVTGTVTLRAHVHDDVDDPEAVVELALVPGSVVEGLVFDLRSGADAGSDSKEGDPTDGR